jgi:Holliday junction resolvase RusA-like endonuclease
MDFADPPFACPPDIVVDVPPPPSVNRARRVDWANHKAVEAWRKHANGMLALNRQGKKKHAGRFELLVVVDEKATRCDLDNVCKLACDYLKRIEVIEDDGPKYMRRLVVEFGHAPAGVRLIVKPIEGNA